jgi:uncharacterized membrane protein YeiH
MEEIEYLWICVVTGAGTFLLWPHLERILGVSEADEWIDWGDAIGVGAFCVIGAMNGIRAGVPCAAAVACGMFTATFGGVVRDGRAASRGLQSSMCLRLISAVLISYCY